MKPHLFAEPRPLDLKPSAEPLAQALDIQHDTDPAHDHGPARRIPHLGHALLFFSLTLFFLSLSLTLIWAAFHIRTDEAARAHPGIALAAQALAYALTLAASFWLFPRLWSRSFLHGIQWNVLAARRRWLTLLPAAMLLAVAALYAQQFVHVPDTSPLDDLMQSARSAWLTVAFGVLLAPLTEEIAFRGFLLPALATAYDWLALERTPAGLERWRNSSLHSTAAVCFAAIFSSVPFALLHAGQLSHAWGLIAILYAVSLALSLVRIRTHSVACSTLVHATYNATIFALSLLPDGLLHHLDKLSR